jgi:isocitrate/isopropylmalate dehydrogenase
MTRYRIAVIPGDGIGQEVVPVGLHVLEAAAAKHGLRFEWDGLPWGCDYYRQHGRMMPQDALRGHDAIYLGAEGSHRPDLPLVPRLYRELVRNRLQREPHPVPSIYSVRLVNVDFRPA